MHNFNTKHLSKSTIILKTSNMEILLRTFTYISDPASTLPVTILLITCTTLQLHVETLFTLNEPYIPHTHTHTYLLPIPNFQLRTPPGFNFY